jgi:hypothetical protein
MFLPIIFSLIAVSYALEANPFNTSLPSSQESLLFNASSEEIIINHRILAKVNDKLISVIDVMKKMDLIFYKQYPQYADSKRARLQFYQMQWRHVLQDLIDRELVAADASEHQLTISLPDIRKEMEKTLGPNIIESLDKTGLTLEEATKMLQEDVILRQMMSARVNTRAQKSLTPQNVRLAYEEYAKANTKPAEWIYSVISVRNANSALAQAAAQKAHDALISGTLSWEDDLLQKITAIEGVDPSTTFSVSEEYRHSEKEMSLTNKEVLLLLQPDGYSAPVAQKSRSDQSIVYRIFYLKEMSEGGVPVLADVELDIKEKLYQQAVERETKVYLKRLHEHFGYNESDVKAMIPEDFQPFTMRKA